MGTDRVRATATTRIAGGPAIGAQSDQLIVDVLLGTGMRMGEAQGLHKEHIDLKRKTITIEWAWDKAAKRIKPPKDYERRMIPIGDTLAKTLATVIKKDGLGEPAPVPYVSSRTVRSGLLLAHIGGRPFDQDNFKKRFDAASRVAWVHDGDDKRRLGKVRPHGPSAHLCEPPGTRQGAFGSGSDPPGARFGPNHPEIREIGRKPVDRRSARPRLTFAVQ
ncbi:tyrosine-type recombinase/integrase [Nocardia uniformis]|uniref:tyrosine-type recombinase/integrase n=2 Tax=Nocardia uniformis TaxID=53432 RepID=UPI0040680BDF